MLNIIGTIVIVTSTGTPMTFEKKFETMEQCATSAHELYIKAADKLLASGIVGFAWTCEKIGEPA